MTGNREYRLHFFVEIRHSFDGDPDKAHDHTVEIKCKIGVSQEDIVRFDEIEDTVERIIARYDRHYLNDMEVFGGDTTIEHLGEVLCAEIDSELGRSGYDMNRFEIGETPLRSYIITDELRE